MAKAVSELRHTKTVVGSGKDRKYSLKILQLPGETPAAAGHTFASLMAKAGVQPEVLQKIIGHADCSTTADIYIHADLNQLKDAIDKL